MTLPFSRAKNVVFLLFHRKNIPEFCFQNVVEIICKPKTYRFYSKTLFSVKYKRMKDNSQSNAATAQFLKTDGGKTKSNAIEVPSISLPKGGGAIKGIDEKFSVNAVNG